MTGIDISSAQIDFFIIVSPWTSYQLRHDDTFRAVNDKGAGRGHYGEVAHKDFLFFNVALRFIE